MSDLPLPLRVHEGQVDGEVYILGADEEPVVRVYGYTAKESLERAAVLTRAANLAPHYARCVEALELAKDIQFAILKEIRRHSKIEWDGQLILDALEGIRLYEEVIAALRAAETEEGR